MAIERKMKSKMYRNLVRRRWGQVRGRNKEVKEKDTKFTWISAKICHMLNHKMFLLYYLHVQCDTLRKICFVIYFILSSIYCNYIDWPICTHSYVVYQHPNTYWNIIEWFVTVCIRVLVCACSISKNSQHNTHFQSNQQTDTSHIFSKYLVEKHIFFFSVESPKRDVRMLHANTWKLVCRCQPFDVHFWVAWANWWIWVAHCLALPAIIMDWWNHISFVFVSFNR